MAERIGQYYFEVEKGQFVNKGNLRELDSRGRERFSWRRLGVGLAVASGVAFVGTFTGAGVVGMFKGIPLWEFSGSRMSDADSGAYAIGMLLGITAVGVAAAVLDEGIKRIRINRSFVKS